MFDENLLCVSDQPLLCKSAPVTLLLVHNNPDSRIANIQLGRLAQRILNEPSFESELEFGWCPLGDLIELPYPHIGHVHAIQGGRVKLEQRVGLFAEEPSLAQNVRSHAVQFLPESVTISEWILKPMLLPAMSSGTNEVDRRKISSPQFCWEDISIVCQPATSNLDIHDYTSLVVEAVEAVLGPELVVGLTDHLFAQGMTSIQAVRLSRQLSQSSDLKLSAVMAFNYPSIQQIAKHLRSLCQTDAVSASDLTAQIPQYTAHGDVGVVGAMCTHPGSPAARIRSLLLQGKDLSQKIPVVRFDVDALDGTDSALYAKGGYFVQDVDTFDHQAFRISQSEAAVMDPHQRLLLEMSYAVLAVQGSTRQSLAGSQTAVFVGIMSSSEWTVSTESGFAASATGAANLAGRVSYVLDLQGAAFSVESLCSSSLVALDIGNRTVLSGDCTQALVAGVNLLFQPTISRMLCTIRALSPNSRCKTFDSLADGMVRGEAIAALTLSKYTDSGEAHRAELVSSALNQDGHSAAMTAPNGLAQAALLRTALLHSTLATLPAIECHGTGTQLGDPIEVGAIDEVHILSASLAAPIMLGALKSNIGHTEGAAGLMGVMKIVSLLEQGAVGPNLHLKTRSSKLGLASQAPAGAPTEMCLMSSAWQSKRALGVSSFGMSGTNAHAIAGKRKCSAAYTELPVVYYSSLRVDWKHAGPTETPVILDLHAVEDRAAITWEQQWSVELRTYMSQHRVGQVPISPGTGFMQMGRMGASHCVNGTVTLVNIVFTSPLFLDRYESAVSIQMSVIKESSRINIDSRDDSLDRGPSAGWLQNATMLATSGSEAVAPDPNYSSGGVTAMCTGNEFYSQTGNDYRGDFRALEAVWLIGEDTVLCKVSMNQVLLHQVILTCSLYIAQCTLYTTRCILWVRVRNIVTGTRC